MFTKVVEKIKTHFVFKFPPPPRKSRLFLDKMEKYYGAGQATDDNMAHCRLDT